MKRASRQELEPDQLSVLYSLIGCREQNMVYLHMLDKYAFTNTKRGPLLMKQSDNHHAPFWADIRSRLHRLFARPWSLGKIVQLVVIGCLLAFIVWMIVFPFYLAWGIYDSVTFLRHATSTAQGNVISFNQQVIPATTPGQITTVYCNNTILFQTADGRQITFSDNSDTCNDTAPMVLYDPAHPTDARTSTSVREALIGGGIIDGAYVLLAIGMTYYTVRQRRTKNKASVTVCAWKDADGRTSC